MLNAPICRDLKDIGFLVAIAVARYDLHLRPRNDIRRNSELE